jgi:hypothetical protein
MAGPPWSHRKLCGLHWAIGTHLPKQKPSSPTVAVSPLLQCGVGISHFTVEMSQSAEAPELGAAPLHTFEGTHGPKQPSFVVCVWPAGQCGGTTSQVAGPWLHANDPGLHCAMGTHAPKQPLITLGV